MCGKWEVGTIKTYNAPWGISLYLMDNSNYLTDKRGLTCFTIKKQQQQTIFCMNAFFATCVTIRNKLIKHKHLQYSKVEQQNDNKVIWDYGKSCVFLTWHDAHLIWQSW